MSFNIINIQTLTSMKINIKKCEISMTIGDVTVATDNLSIGSSMTTLLRKAMNFAPLQTLLASFKKYKNEMIAHIETYYGDFEIDENCTKRMIHEIGKAKEIYNTLKTL